jgi:lipopolysaccharide biosynthesis glycosyltransferase
VPVLDPDCNLHQTRRRPVMHIAFSVDEKFVLPLCAMLSSFFRHHRGESVCIHVLAGSLPESAQRRLQEFVQARGATYRYHAIKAAQFDGPPLAAAHLSNATLYRLLLPQLLPELDRILYLDTDLLIRRSLLPLYSADLCGLPVAAVMDAFPENACRRLGIQEEHGYFNAGVLVMDLNALRRDRIAEHALAYVERHRADPERCLAADQDGLNVVLEGRWRRLPDTWNFNLTFCARDPAQLPGHLYQQLLEGPAVVHYCGRKKPWMRLFVLPFQTEFLDAARHDGIHFDRGWGLRDFRERFSEVQRFNRLRRRHRRAGAHVPGLF